MYAFSVKQIGSSHVECGKVCQDESFSFCNEHYVMAVVADGHGGDKYFRSDRGAQFATIAADATIGYFMFQTEKMTKMPKGDWLRQLCATIITQWQRLIEKDYQAEPFQTDGRWQEAYGTTLIVAVRTEQYFFALQIGDGTCVTMDENGKCRQPIPKDKKCFLNRTTSLCDTDAINNFRTVFMDKDLPMTAFVASDGVDDTYTSNKVLYSFYNKLNEMFHQNKWKAEMNLEAFLPSMSEKGSHDDISIAGLFADIENNYDDIEDTDEDDYED